MESKVSLISHMGDDLTVANAARVSFGKTGEVLDEKAIKLIHHLAKHKHMSPFRHVQFTLVIHTSEVVMRQLYKHQVGIGYTSGGFRESATVWNEISGRYTEVGEEFYRPDFFRTQHPVDRQASTNECIKEMGLAGEIYEAAISHAQAAYQRLLGLGVCREQARMVLPISFMTTVTLTASLEALVHLIRLRDHEGAQKETRDIAKAVRSLIEPICPVSVSALLGQP